MTVIPECRTCGAGAEYVIRVTPVLAERIEDEPFDQYACETHVTWVLDALDLLHWSYRLRALFGGHIVRERRKRDDRRQRPA